MLLKSSNLWRYSIKLFKLERSREEGKINEFNEKPSCIMHRFNMLGIDIEPKVSIWFHLTMQFVLHM